MAVSGRDSVRLIRPAGQEDINMGSAAKDLDRFLMTAGRRMLEGTCYFKTAAWKPLTEEDIGGFRSMDLNRLNNAELEDLLDHLEDLLDVVEDGEPEDRQGEAYARWEYRLGETRSIIRRVLGRLEEREAG